jgi:VWFA-related protein
MKTTVASKLGVVVGTLAALAAAVLPGQTARFGGEETVVAVEIPVQVLVDGKPVRGLTKESFEVLEGRKRQAIVDFEVVDLTTMEAPSGRAVAVTPTVSPAGRRHFLLLFDMTNSEPQAIVRARGAASELVLQSLHPTDLVAVATWSYSKGPRLLLGFTSDRRQIDVAVATLGVVDLRNTTPDPFGLILADLDSQSLRPGIGGGAGGGKGQFEDIYEENVRDFAASERALARQVNKATEIEALTKRLRDSLANLMGNVDGRKHVVLLSQGFDSSVLLGSGDAARESEFSASAASGEIWNVNSAERFGDTASVNRLEEMLTVFRRADCSIQAVDIGGMAAGNDQGFRKTGGRETLLTMAKDTGGQLFENFNNLGEAMGQMLETTSVTYVLTIQPQNLKLDGKFHDIKVRLNGGPSGARLVHRPGYYAPTPYEKRSGAERQIDSASLIVSGRPGGDLAATVATAAFRAEGDRMHVPVVVEVDGALLLTAKQGNALALNVYIYAFDDAGSVRDFVAQSLQLDVAQIGARLNREPLKYVADLRLPPGNYAVRTLLRAGETGSYWLGETPVTVSAFAAGELVAVTPLVPEPMTAGIVVRSSSSAERTQGLAFPFVLGQDFYLPRGTADDRQAASAALLLQRLRADDRTRRGRRPPGRHRWRRRAGGVGAPDRSQRIRSAGSVALRAGDRSRWRAGRRLLDRAVGRAAGAQLERGDDAACRRLRSRPSASGSVWRAAGSARCATAIRGCSPARSRRAPVRRCGAGRAVHGRRRAAECGAALARVAAAGASARPARARRSIATSSPPPRHRGGAPRDGSYRRPPTATG